MHPRSRFRFAILAVVLACSAAAQTQTDPLAQLNAAQRTQYDSALQLFKTEHYSEALAAFRQILPQLLPGTPAQIQIAKFAAESAINAGDRDSALPLLKPIEAADVNDWQASSMLARVYAETGQRQLRDAELAHLVDLHTRAASPQIARMTQIVLERIPIDANRLIRVWYSLEPWGPYKIYLFARVYEPSGRQVLRLTLESSDFDQALFAQQHPDLAAKGTRCFSLDGYGPDQKLPNGPTTQTHFTFGLFDGQPSYDIGREQLINIANGKTKPKTQRDVPVPGN